MFLIALHTSSTDLLSQKWDAKKDDYKHSVSMKSQADNITISSTATVDDPAFSSLSGKSKVEYKDKAWGDASLEVATNGKFKGTTKFSKLQKGLVVSAEAETNLKACPTGKVSTEYSRESAAVTAEFNQAKNAVTVSAAVGVEGLSAGFVAAADVNAVKSGAAFGSAVSVDAGVQYEDGNLIGTAVVEKQSHVVLSLYHRVSAAFQVGTRVTVTPAANSAFAAAAQYKFNPATLAKTKVEVSDNVAKGEKSFTVSTYVEHKLSNPDVVVGLANQFGPAGNKYGVSVSFGDK